MTYPNARRLTACLVAAAALGIAIAAPAAHATVSNTLNIGAQLLDQPKGQPWAVNLLLGAQVIESTGQENLPITTKFVFQFPRANVNPDKFPVCKATDGDFVKQGPNACSSGSIIGKGTADARALSLPIPADVTLYNGKGTKNNRELVLYAYAPSVGVKVILRGHLRKINRGNFGYEFELPIPPIEVLQGQLVSIEGFQITVGKRIRKGGKLISFIDAPQKCSGAGWPFTFRDELQGGVVATANATISCVIKAT